MGHRRGVDAEVSEAAPPSGAAQARLHARQGIIVYVNGFALIPPCLGHYRPNRPVSCISYHAFPGARRARRLNQTGARRCGSWLTQVPPAKSGHPPSSDRTIQTVGVARLACAASWCPQVVNGKDLAAGCWVRRSPRARGLETPADLEVRPRRPEAERTETTARERGDARFRHTAGAPRAARIIVAYLSAKGRVAHLGGQRLFTSTDY